MHRNGKVVIRPFVRQKSDWHSIKKRIEVHCHQMYGNMNKTDKAYFFVHYIIRTLHENDQTLVGSRGYWRTNRLLHEGLYHELSHGRPRFVRAISDAIVSARAKKATTDSMSKLTKGQINVCMPTVVINSSCNIHRAASMHRGLKCALLDGTVHVIYPERERKIPAGERHIVPIRDNVHLLLSRYYIVNTQLQPDHSAYRDQCECIANATTVLQRALSGCNDLINLVLHTFLLPKPLMNLPESAAAAAAAAAAAVDPFASLPITAPTTTPATL